MSSQRSGGGSTIKWSGNNPGNNPRKTLVDYYDEVHDMVVDHFTIYFLKLNRLNRVCLFFSSSFR